MATPPNRLAAMLERLRRALGRDRPVPAKRRGGLEGSPAPAAEPPPEAPRVVIFVTVLGLSPAALEDVLDLVLEDTRERWVSPVFITDGLDFKPFRDRRLRFEYLPDRGARQRFAPELDWSAYERGRYRLLVEKWRPRSLISFGTPPPPACVAVVRSPAS